MRKWLGLTGKSFWNKKVGKQIKEKKKFGLNLSEITSLCKIQVIPPKLPWDLVFPPLAKRKKIQIFSKVSENFGRN